MRTQLELGATLDTLNQTELRQELAAQTQEVFQQMARGCKYLRFGPSQATPANSTVTFDGTNHRQVGPKSGYIWSVRRLTIWGLTAGTTPDVVNLYRNSPTGVPIWQFNGNNFAYTFGKLEILLLPGETLSFAGTSIAATSPITISGDYMEVASEEIFKLF